MEILRFVNSRDIRAHLKKIDYKFTPLEAAWLVYQCRTASFEEKHAAWTEIISTMPDCPIKMRHEKDSRESLHGFLKDYMRLENKWRDAFCSRNDVAVYQYRWKEQGHACDNENVFTSYDSCLKEITEELQSSEVGNVLMIKRYLDDKKCDEASIRPDGTLMSLWGIHDPEDADCDLGGAFENFWFAFPTPFQKGDVIWDPNQPCGCCRGPFVITGIVSPDGNYFHYDTSDMNAWGYFQCEDNGNIYSESMWNYMDCEYYREKLTGKRRIFKVLSSFLKNEIDVGLFARAYHQILTEEYAKDCIPRDYTAESMLLAGLGKEEPGITDQDSAEKHEG